MHAKGHTAGPWQTLNLNPRLFLPQRKHFPSSPQRPQSEKREVGAMYIIASPVEGKIDRQEENLFIDRVVYFGYIPQTSSVGVKTPPTSQRPEPEAAEPRCDRSGDTPDAVLLRLPCSDGL